MHYGARALAKTKAKTVPKTKAKKANEPAGSLFLDKGETYFDYIGGSKYWLRAIDDDMHYALDCTITKKSDLQEPFKLLLTINKEHFFIAKLLLWNDAGENVKHLSAVCSERGTKSEMIAPHTTQMTGVVEHPFITA